MKTVKKNQKRTTASHCALSVSLALALMLPTAGYGSYSSNESGNSSYGKGIYFLSGGQQSSAVGVNISANSQAAAVGNNINATGYGATAMGGDDAGGFMYENYARDYTFSSSGYRYLTANATGSIALGAEAWAGGKDLGSNGQSDGDSGRFAVAIGTRASAYGYSSLALGGHSIASANDALAMMSLSTASGKESIAIGVKSKATRSSAIALGYNSAAQAENALALGLNTEAAVTGSVALGSTSATAAPVSTASVIINGKTYNFAGDDAYSTVSLGNFFLKRTVTNVAAGRITADSTDAVNGSQLYATNQALEASAVHYVSIKGTTAEAGSNYNNDGAVGLASIAIGQSAFATGSQSVAIGNTAKALRQSDVAIGSMAGSDSAMQGSSVYIGLSAGQKAQKISTNPLAFGAVLVGTQAGESSVGDANVAIGHYAGGYGKGSQNVFLGVYAGARDHSKPGSRNVVIGSQEIQDDSMLTGAGYVDDTIAIGTKARADQSRAVALGRGAFASVEDSVALGSNSTTAAAVGTSTMIVNGKTYSLAGGKPVSTVSLGSAGKERTITNVAAGRVSATSTDAINGSQLFSTNEAVKSVQAHANSLTAALGGGASYSPATGIWTAPKYEISGKSYNNVADAISALDFIDANLQKGFNIAAGGKTHAVALGGGSTVPTVNFAAEKNAVVTLTGNTVTYSVADSPDFAGIVTGRGFNASGNKITSVAPGTEGADAVNLGQLDSAVKLLGGGAAMKNGSVTAPTYQIRPAANQPATPIGTVGNALNLHESRLFVLEDSVSNRGLGFKDSANKIISRKLGDVLTVKGGANGNITTVVTDTGELLISVDHAPNFSGTVKAAGFDAKGQKITSVADGSVNNTSTDAVTGRQLFDVDQKAVAAQATATRAENKADVNKGEIEKIKTDTGNIGETVNKGLTVAGDSGSNNFKLGQTMTVKGDERNLSTSMSDAGVLSISLKPDVTLTSVTAGGIKISGSGVAMDGKKITGLAAGDLVVGGTEGVNTGQLHDAYSKVASTLGTTLNNGILVDPAYQVGGVTYKTVGNALAALNSQAGTVVYVTADGTRVYKDITGEFFKNVDNAGVGVGPAIDKNKLRHALVMPDGTVSGGRGLSNVGIGKDDTDAVNVSQLKDALNAVGGGAGINSDGSVKDPSWQIKTAAGSPATAVTNVGDALTRHESRLVTAETDLSELSSKPLTIEANAGSANRTLGQTLKVLGGNTNITTSVRGVDTLLINLSSNPTFSGKVTAYGFDAGNAKIVKVAAGEAVTDAVNKGQLDALNTALDTSNNVAVKYDDAATKNLVTLGGKTADGALFVSGGVELTNLQDGTVAKGSRDAVTGNQLYEARSNLAKYLGGGAKVGDDGSVTHPTYKIGDSDYSSVGDALNALKRKSGPVVYVTDDGQQVYKASNNKFYTKLNHDGSGVEGTAVEVDTLRHALLMPEEGVTGGRGLANVGAGKNDTDAVNVSQLKPVVTALGASLDINGAVIPPSYAIKGNTYNTVGEALTGLTNFIDGGIALKMNSGDTSRNLAIGDALNLSVGKNMNIRFVGDDTTNPKLRSYFFSVVDSPDFKGTVKARGFDASSNKIINLAEGTAPTDAVTLAQLKAAVSGVSGTVNEITLNSPVVYAADVGGSSKYVMLYKDPADGNKLKAYNTEDWDTANNKPNVGARAIDLDKVYVAGMGFSLGTGAQGIDHTPIRMSNVAHGRGKNDAVNVEQLEQVVSSIGSGMKINETTGIITKPSFKMPGARTYHNVGSVIIALKTGTVGPMVYTASDGERLVYLKDPKENGTTTYERAGWYRLSKVDPDGMSLIPGATQSEAEVAADNVRLSLVDAANSFAGNTGGTMILSNLAPGQIDNDAVNVSQLKKLVDIVGDGATLNADGSISMPTWLIKPSATEAATPVTNVSEALMRHEKRITEDEGKLGQLTGKPLIFKTTEGVAERKLGETLTVQGSNGNISTSITPEGVMTITLASAPDFVGKVRTFGLDVKGEKITNVSAGEDPGDAVNKSQLEALRNDMTTKDGAVVKYDNATTKDSVTLGTGANPALADGVKLTNLAAGAVTDTSKDAVRGSQLFEERRSLAGYLGGGATVNDSGTFEKPTYNIDSGNYHNVGDALNALDRKSGAVVYVKGNGKLVHRANDGKYYNELGENGIGVGDPIDEATLHLALKTADDSVTSPRRLSNVAEGKINNESSDAVTGKQIKEERDALAQYLGGGASVAADGTMTPPSYRIGSEEPKTNVGDALSALNKQAFNHFTVTADSGAVKPTVKLGDSFAIKGKDGGNISTNSTVSGITVSLTDTPKFGEVMINSGGKITGLADGTVAVNSRDAVTGGQLQAVINKIGTETGALTNKPMTFKANSGTKDVKLGESLSIIGSDTTVNVDGYSATNVATEVNGNNLVIKFADAPVFEGAVTAPRFVAAGAKKITIDGEKGLISGLQDAVGDSDAVNKKQMETAIEKVKDNITAVDGLAVKYDDADKDVVTLGGENDTGHPIVADGVTLTNLKDGLVRGDSRDAVTGKQLFDTSRRIANLMGAGTSVGGDGVITDPTFKVDGDSYHNVGSAVAALNRRSGTVVYVSAADAATRVHKAIDGKFYTEIKSDGTGVGPGIEDSAVKQALLAPDGTTHKGRPSILTNVGRGRVDSESTEAVNGSQLRLSYDTMTEWMGGGANFDYVEGSAKFTKPAFSIGGATYNTVADAFSAVQAQAFKPLVFKGNNTESKIERKGGETLNIVGGAGAGVTGSFNGNNLKVIAEPGTGTLKLLFAEKPFFEEVRSSGFIVQDGPSLTVEGLNMQNKPVLNVDHKDGDNNVATNKSVEVAIGKVLSGSGGLDELKNLVVKYEKGSDKGTIALEGARGTIISNLKAGVNDTDAVNLGQLHSVDKRVRDVKSQVDKNTTAISNLQAGSKTSVNYDNEKKDSLTLGGVKADGTPAQDPVALKNVAKGSIAKDSTDAVTGGQMHDAAENLRDLIGGDAKNVGGKVTAGNIGGTGKGTIDDAIRAINTDASSALKSWQAQLDGKAVRTVDKANPSLNFVTGDNIVLSNEKGAIKIATARNVNFDRVTTGKTELSNEGLKIKGGPSVTDKGIDAGGKPISNVGRGTNPNDAATVGQVTEMIGTGGGVGGANWGKVVEQMQGMDKRISSVGAMAAAFSAMMPLDFDEMNPTMFSVGFGHYSGQNAVSLGLQHYANRDLLFNAGMAWSNDEKMFRLGATWRMGSSPKYQTQRVSTTELKALREVSTLQQTVAVQKEELTQMDKQMTERDLRMVEQEKQLQEQRRLIEVLMQRMGQLEKKK